MDAILSFIILFLIGFVPEFLLLNLDDAWKLLGLVYPAVTLAAAGHLLSGTGTQVCGMPTLILMILTAPYFVGIATAAVLRLLIWLLKSDKD